MTPSAPLKPLAGKYAIEGIIGQGGMGTVFEARHVRVGQRVAIKVLGSALCGYPELVERFEREARACGSLSSMHAVRVFDIDTTEDGTPFIVMERLTGRDLSQILEREGPQPVARAVGWLIEACDAVAEAHGLGIIHRDLKPSNLFLSQVDGRAVIKVLDFGIAKHGASASSAITHAQTPLGTPQYMSPEQVRCSKDVDARSDIWSLGVTLYELVTGVTPFPEPSASACIAAIAADPVPDPRLFRPELGEKLVEVLMRALAKDPNDRYPSIDAFVAALAPFAIGPVVAPVVELLEVEPCASYRIRTFVPRALLGSGADRTVPPAITATRADPRRVRSRALTFASAAVLGVAALVVAARWIDANATDTPTQAPLAVAPLTVVAPPPPAPPAPDPVEPPAEPIPTPLATELATAPVPTPLAVPPPPPVVRASAPSLPHAVTVGPRPLVARPLVAALAAPSADAKPSASARTVEKRAQTTASRTVHGGLTGPGF